MTTPTQPRGPEGGVFTTSLGTRIFAGLFALIPLALAAGAFATDPRSPPLTLLAAVGASVALLAIMLGFASCRVDHNGVQRLTPLTVRIRLLWGDVTSIEAQSLGSLLVRGRLGTTMSIPLSLRGRDEIARLVLAHAPQASMSDTVRRTLEQQSASAPPTAVPVDAPEGADAAPDPLERWRDNPFFVLGLSPQCSRAEVERAGQKLLAMLAIGSSAARTYASPLGPGARTEEKVRAAMGELRDPDRRIGHELWGRIEAAQAEGAAPAKDAEAAPWAGAMAAIGWRKT